MDNNIYEELKFLIDNWKQKYYEKKKELEDLTQYACDLEDKICYLNGDWNNLKEWIKNEDNQNDLLGYEVVYVDEILSKMKEIKGDNMINNPYDLSDEEIYGGEPTWEEQEIERLKEKIIKLEDKLEEKECCIKMALDKIDWTNFVQVETVEKLFAYLTELKNILKNESELNDSNV